MKRLQLQDHKALRVEVVVRVSRRYIYLYLEGNLSIRRVHSRELWDRGRYLAVRAQDQGAGTIELSWYLHLMIIYG